MPKFFYKSILLIAFLFSVYVVSAQEKPTYESLIQSADSYLAKKDYYNAKTTYQLALQMKADAEYPKKKIAEIIQKLNAEMDVRIAYEDNMQLASSAYAEKDYAKALSLYRAAADMLPDEQEPKQQITQIEQEWKALQEKQKAFDTLLKEAQAAEGKQDYITALAKYESANALFPNNADVLTRLAQIKLLQKQQASRQESFDKLMDDGDKRMQQNRFALALEKYREAGALFPNNSVVIEKITAAEQAIEREKKYKEAVDKGDSFYIALDLEQAKQAYTEATKIWPEKAYPVNMLEKLAEAQKRRTEELEQLQADYEAEIADADGFFNAQKYDQAYDSYIRALNLKPDEKYPLGQVQKINKLLASGYIEIKCVLHDNEEPLSGAVIGLTVDGNTENIAVGDNGKHKLKLKFNKVYALNFQKEGFVHKIFTIDTHLPDDENLNTIFSTDLSVELFPTCQIDLSFFDKPMAEIDFDKASGEFTYDSRKVMSVIRQAQTLKDECARVLAEAEKQKEYNTLLAQAKELKASEDYSAAIATYQQASAMYPNENLPKDEIKALNILLEENKAYTNFLAQGDAKYAQGKLNDALFDYYKARNLKPKAAYPQQQIKEIDAILAARNAEEQRYAQQLKVADSLFAAKQWEQSIVGYEKAIALKASDAYPKNRLAEARKFLQAQQELDNAYQAAIKQGDTYFEAQNLAEARTFYLQANKLKPNEQYPLYKIEDINTIVEQQDIRKTNNRYKELIASADGFFGSKAYEQAVNTYRQASNLKPNEQYPKDQIAKIEALLASNDKLEKQYNQKVKSADSAFYLEEYTSSRAFYVAAQELKPEKNYPPQQIQKIDDLLAAMRDKEKNYTEALARADAAFEKKEYTKAQPDYSLASNLKPQESYPKEQLKKIEDILAQMGATEAAYLQAIKNADSQYRSERYVPAINAYKEALKIKPNEEYPASQIAAIETLLAKLDKVNAAYNQAIAKADGFYGQKEYQQALTHYKEALNIKPDESYPPDQIRRINQLLSQALNAEEAYKQALADGDKLFAEEKYQLALSPYQKAQNIKPTASYPPEQIAKIRELLGGSQRDYDALIKQGDKAYQMAVYQEAIVAYEGALDIFPNETYPRMMLDKIEAKIRRESVVVLVDKPEMLVAGKEKRYQFKPVDFRDRQDNYILIEMKNASDDRIRVFISFGKDGIKNGGYSVNLVKRDGYTKYFVRIDRQLRWQNEDNNWISLLPEGGDLDVSRIQISRSEKL